MNEDKLKKNINKCFDKHKILLELRNIANNILMKEFPELAKNYRFEITKKGDKK